MNRAVAVLILASVTLAPWARAQADETDVCLSAPVDGQRLQKAGKLLDAHTRFVTCASKTCPAEIVQDCTRWATEVEAATPTVALGARDENGRELVDVAVSIDGAPPSAIGALAIAVDPGLHTFTFKRGGHEDLVESGVLREGEKNREMVVRYMPPAPRQVPDVTTQSRPVPASVWIAGGVSVAGLALFGAIGALGVSTRATDHCATGCSAAQNSDVQTKFDIADVSLGVGVAALGVAAWQFFARPTVLHPVARVDVEAVPGGGVATFNVRW